MRCCLQLVSNLYYRYDARVFIALTRRFILMLVVLIWVGTASASVTSKIGHVSNTQPNVPMAVNLASEHCVQRSHPEHFPAAAACEQCAACVGAGVSLPAEGFTPFVFQVPESIIFRDSTPFIHEHFSIPLLRPPLT